MRLVSTWSGILVVSSTLLGCDLGRGWFGSNAVEYRSNSYDEDDDYTGGYDYSDDNYGWGYAEDDYSDGYSDGYSDYPPAEPIVWNREDTAAMNQGDGAPLRGATLRGSVGYVSGIEAPAASVWGWSDQGVLSVTVQGDTSNASAMALLELHGDLTTLVGAGKIPLVAPAYYGDAESGVKGSAMVCSGPYALSWTYDAPGMPPTVEVLPTDDPETVEVLFEIDSPDTVTGASQRVTGSFVVTPGQVASGGWSYDSDPYLTYTATEAVLTGRAGPIQVDAGDVTTSVAGSGSYMSVSFVGTEDYSNWFMDLSLSLGAAQLPDTTIPLPIDNWLLSASAFSGAGDGWSSVAYMTATYTRVGDAIRLEFELSWNADTTTDATQTTGSVSFTLPE